MRLPPAIKDFRAGLDDLQLKAYTELKNGGARISRDDIDSLKAHNRKWKEAGYLDCELQWYPGIKI